MTTDQTEAATRARMAERVAFARGARLGSEAVPFPPPPHVEPPAPRPFGNILGILSGAHVPPAVAGAARAILEAAAIGALSKGASLLAVAHVPAQYAALAAAGVLLLRAIEGVIDQTSGSGS